MRGLDVLALLPSEHLSDNEIAAAAVADQNNVFNPQQQFRVSWPAVPVVARAYLDQLQRSGSLSASFVEDLSAALDESEALLGDGARDKRLARKLKSLAAAVKEADGDAVTNQRRAELAETLSGIGSRLM